MFHENGKRFQWSDFTHHPTFIVGANENYWRYWKERYEKQNIDVESWRNSLPLTIRFFSFADFDFKKQKETVGTEGKYTPSVFDKTEWKEEFLLKS